MKKKPSWQKQNIITERDTSTAGDALEDAFTGADIVTNDKQDNQEDVDSHCIEAIVD